jgi:hypothetical protein
MLLHPHPQPEHETGDPGHGNNYSTPIGLALRISDPLRPPPPGFQPAAFGAFGLPGYGVIKYAPYLDIYAH